MFNRKRLISLLLLFLLLISLFPIDHIVSADSWVEHRCRPTGGYKYQIGIHTGDNWLQTRDDSNSTKARINELQTNVWGIYNFSVSKCIDKVFFYWECVVVGESLTLTQINVTDGATWTTAWSGSLQWTNTVKTLKNATFSSKLNVTQMRIRITTTSTATSASMYEMWCRNWTYVVSPPSSPYYFIIGAGTHIGYVDYTNYTAGAELHLYNLSFFSHGIRFNSTTFQFSASPVNTKENISLYYIRYDPLNASTPGLYLLNYTLYTKASTAAINQTIGGFHTGYYYGIYKDDVLYQTKVADASGKIWFINSSGAWDGSTHSFKIKIASASPVVTTQAASSITHNSAILNGYLDDEGASPCRCRFQYGTTYSYGTNTTNQTKTTGQSFSASISGLLPSTVYHFRTIANDTTPTTSYGSDLWFTTTAAPSPPSSKVYPPTNLWANWTTSSSVLLNWTKGVNSTRTSIVRKTGGYPSTCIDGTVVYNGTAIYYNDTSVTPATRYYYAGWAWNTTTGNKSVEVKFMLAETDNTSTIGSSWADFKGYLTTSHTTQARFIYSTTEHYTQTQVSNIILEDYYTGTRDSDIQINSANWGGQSFLTTASYHIRNVTFYAKKTGGPGRVYVYLYDANTSGPTYGLPSGVALSNGSNDPSGLTSSYVWYNITMTDYHLKSNTKYCIIAMCIAGGPNKVQLGSVYHTPGYTDGCTVVSTDGGLTYTNHSPDYDTLFKIWNATIIIYGNGLDTTNTTITTSTSLSTLQTGLLPGLLYYYKLNANDTTNNKTDGNTRFTLTNPTVPIFLSLTPDFGAKTVTISWVNGTGANRTVVVEGTGGSYPASPSDGYIVYNGTSTSVTITNISFNTSYHYSLFSYTTWAGLSRFSSAAHVPWGGLSFNCFNETSGAAIGFSVLITDSWGNHVYYGPNLHGWQFINVSQIPYGANTVFYVTNSSGKFNSRTYTKTIYADTFYNLSFYLPRTLTPPTGNTSYLYHFQVYETVKTMYAQQTIPVSDVNVSVKHYLSTIDSFVEVASMLTDSNGMVVVYLVENDLYLIQLSKQGYISSSNPYTATPPNVYGQTELQSYQIILQTSGGGGTNGSVTPETLFTNITFTLEPSNKRWTSGFTIWFNISSTDGRLEWYRMDIYFKGVNDSSYSLLSSQNDSNPYGGSLSYSIPNVTGQYSVECWFKKAGYDQYEIYHSGSIIYFITHIQDWARQIPDYAYYIIMIIITMVVMGLCLMYFATGVATGYIGLGVMAFMLLLRGDVSVPIDVSGGNPVVISAWIIWGITFLIYSAALFLWSRL